MKICILMPSFEEGGVQSLVNRLYRGFKEENHDVTILVGDASGKMKKIFTKKDVIDLGESRHRGDYKILFAKNKIKKIFMKNDFHIVLAVPGFSTIMATFFKKYVSGKVLVIVDDKPSLLLERGLKHKLVYYLYRFFYKRADMVITAHDCGLKDITDNYHLDNKKVKRIYYPIIDFGEIAASESFSHRWASGENFIFLSIGRLIKDKDFATLVRAFSLAKKRMSKAKLLIAGEGIERQSLEKLIKDEGVENDVELLGHVSNIYGLLKIADGFVSSSIYEPFGMAIVEALACNVAVISTDTKSGAQREILCDGRYGALCAPGEKNGLADEMVKCYHGEMPKDGIIRAKDFEVKKATKNYIKLFKDLLR